MKWNRWWAIGLVFIVVVVAGGGYWWWSHRSVKPLQAALQTTAVRKGSLAVSITGTGNIESANRAALTSVSSGTIEAVKVKQGDNVRKGQILAAFKQDSTNTVASQIRSKQLDLKKKQLDLGTLQDQYKAAPDDDKRAEIAVSMQKQQIDIESIQADIQTLQDNGDGTLDPITAPVDGTLATFNLAAGDKVGGQGGASSASSLGEVVDYHHLQMVVGIDELDIAKVKLGQQATVLVEAMPDQTFAGKVTSIAQEGTASNGVSTFNVTITLDNAQGLKVGMSAEASILIDSKADALYLPIEAVQSFGSRYFVMVPSTADSSASASASAGAGQGRVNGNGSSSFNGQSGAAGNGNANRANRQGGAFAGLSGVKRVPVQVGIHNEDAIEIISGLNEGDKVVVPTVSGTGAAGAQNPVGAGAVPGLGLGRAAGGGGFGAGANGGFGGGNRGNGNQGNRGGGAGG